jgi:hypothetical protein
MRKAEAGYEFLRVADTMNLLTLHRRLDPNNPIRRMARAMRPNARLLATAGYWMITPHKIPARIAVIRQLTSKNEQLSALIAERAAKIEKPSKPCDMDRPLAFMHIPKTSGVALADGLREILPSTTIIGGFDRRHFGAFRSFDTMSPGLRQQIYETFPPAKGIDFISGHVAFSTLLRSRPAARFMTVLREPRSRILSLWMFWRSTADETLAAMGAFRRVLDLSHKPLAEFLNHPEAAHQTDNVAVRMLLWPHPLIADDGFIDSASDERLASEGAARLKTFDFTDVVENPRLEDHMRAFLIRPFSYRRVNETPVPSSGLQIPLEEELTSEALFLLERRSRLDRKLWRAVAEERIAGADLTALSDDTFRRTVARYAALRQCPD